MPSTILHTITTSTLFLGLLIAPLGAAASGSLHPGIAPAGECARPEPVHPALFPRSLTGTDPSAVAAAPPGPGATGGGGGAGGGGSIAGRVVSVSGHVTAGSPGSGSRVVGCGDAIFAGDVVTTQVGGTAGLLVGDVLAQVGGASSAGVGVTAAGAADVSLESGSVRVIDPRQSGAPTRLAAGGAQALFVGNDAQASTTSGGGASICASSAPLAVSGGGGSATAGAGSCVVVTPGQPPAAAPAQQGAIAALTSVCEQPPPLHAMNHVVALPNVSLDFAGGPPLPDPGSEPPRSPCDVPGSVCASGGIVTVEQQPPTTDPFPGGGTGTPP